MGWFLEFDTGTEPLARLVDKVNGYTAFVRAGGPAFPILFWLHSAAREHHLHQRLSAIHTAVPIATAARDHATQANPALAVWTLHGDSGPPRALADLPGQITPEQLGDILRPPIRKRD